MFRSRGKRAAGRRPRGGRSDGGTPRPQPESPSAPPPLAAPVPGVGEAFEPAALTLDALGRKCPIPIIMLADRIREVPVGRIAAVWADDPAARTDIPAWCRMKSQEFVREETLERGWSFHIRRMY